MHFQRGAAGALLLPSIYTAPVNVIDNMRKPLVMNRGLISSALETDRWYPLRLERRRLTPTDAFAFDESKAKANGITTPILVILIGVVGGTISYGVTGLFPGPIILAVTWELFSTWTGSDASISPNLRLKTEGASDL